MGIYRRWAPVYDRITEPGVGRGRRQALKAVDIQPDERVVLIGVGTGADLPLLPPGCHAIGIDLSDEMLSRARLKASALTTDIRLTIGDAEALPFEAASFDVAVLNLILAVVPDARRCLGEALRVVRPGGRLVVFDKFLADGAKPHLMRRLANSVTTALGTDINRSFGDIVRDFQARSDGPGGGAGCGDLPKCRVISNEVSMWSGMYRVIVLERV